MNQAICRGEKVIPGENVPRDEITDMRKRIITGRLLRRSLFGRDVAAIPGTGFLMLMPRLAMDQTPLFL